MASPATAPRPAPPPPPPPPPPSPASVGCSALSVPNSSYSSFVSELLARASEMSVSFTRLAGTPASDTTIVTRPAGLLDPTPSGTTTEEITPPDQRINPRTAAAPKKTPLAENQQRVAESPPNTGSPHKTPGTGFSTTK